LDVLSSRILLHPRDWTKSSRFYREILGLKVYREWGGGVVFFLGGGFLELSGQGGEPIGGTPQLWLQVEDLEREHRRLCALGAAIVEPPVRKPWGLDEMRVTDPDGLRLVLVEVPPEHPLRRRS
jgi:catechol 2,3-dioxygenase-like lactoylglutathione lyase family enzyme